MPTPLTIGTARALLRRQGGANPLAALLTDLKIWVEPDDADGPMVDRKGGKTVTAVNTPTFGSDASGNYGDLERDSTQYWTLGSDSDLKVSDGNFWVWAWIAFESKPPVNCGLVTKDASGGANVREFNMRYYAGGISIALGADAKEAIGILDASVATGTLYLVQGWFDLTNEILGCQVNANAAVTTSTSGYSPPTPGDATYRIGGWQISGSNFDGKIYSSGMAKKVPSADDRAVLWNGGVIPTWAQVNA